jgi:alkenylglycerophosphocholine/alkenylglycerophosphoethanolamine hydrolase
MPKNLRARELALALIAVAAIAVYAYAELHGLGRLALIAKPIPVLALAVCLLPSYDAYRTAMVAGLVASAAGDFLLALGPDRFLAGVAFFFVAHLAYLRAFLGTESRLRPLAALPSLALGLTIFPLLLPSLRGNGLLVPVAIYTLALCAMLWRALARWRPGAPADVVVCMLGAASFVLSDSLLALDRFHAPIDGARGWIMATYWAGQLGIFLSAWRRQVPLAG